MRVREKGFLWECLFANQDSHVRPFPGILKCQKSIWVIREDPRDRGDSKRKRRSVLKNPIGQDDNRDEMLQRVARAGLALEYATEELRGDREVVMTAVASNGWALEYATEDLRGDREVVMTAVASNGWGVNHASEELRGDREVMEAALANTGVDAVGLKARLDPACLLSWLCLKEKKSSATSGSLCVQSAILDNPLLGGLLGNSKLSKNFREKHRHKRVSKPYLGMLGFQGCR